MTNDNKNSVVDSLEILLHGNQRVTLDTDLRHFLLITGLEYRTQEYRASQRLDLRAEAESRYQERKQTAVDPPQDTRLAHGISNWAYGREKPTLRDFRRYLASTGCPRNLGHKSIARLNEILAQYDIEPFQTPRSIYDPPQETAKPKAGGIDRKRVGPKAPRITLNSDVRDFLLVSGLEYPMLAEYAVTTPGLEEIGQARFHQRSYDPSLSQGVTRIRSFFRDGDGRNFKTVRDVRDYLRRGGIGRQFGLKSAKRLAEILAEYGIHVSDSRYKQQRD